MSTPQKPYINLDSTPSSEDESPHSVDFVRVEQVARSPLNMGAYVFILGCCVLLLLECIGGPRASVGEDADEFLVLDDSRVEMSDVALPKCRCAAFGNGASSTDSSLCMTRWDESFSHCMPTSTGGMCTLGARKCTTVSTPQRPAATTTGGTTDNDERPVDGDAEPCLCTFAIPRTCTSVQQCHGTSMLPGGLVLSAAVTGCVNNTACGKCYLGLVSYESAGNYHEDKLLAEMVLNSKAFKDIANRHPEAWQFSRGIHLPSDSPLVIDVPHHRTQRAVEGVRAWYRSKDVKIPRERVWHFDGRSDSVQLFKETGLNARQISCGSQDQGMITSCGATKGELVLTPGVHLCEHISSNSFDAKHVHSSYLRGAVMLTKNMIDGLVAQA